MPKALPWPGPPLFLLITLLPSILNIGLFVHGQQQQYNRHRDGGCEPGQVPAQVQVHSDGRPELSCQWPACSLFPTTSSSSTAPTTADSPRRKPTSTQPSMDGREREAEDEDEEGMRREEDEEEEEEEELTSIDVGRGKRRKRTVQKEEEQQASPVHCADTLGDMVCDLADEWTGALTEVNNGTHISLFMLCCAVDHLSEWAAPLKQIVLGPGQKFGGGPVLHNGEMVAFDLIKEVRKNVTEQNEVRYVLSVHRALCVSPVSAINNSPSSDPISIPKATFTRLYGTRFTSATEPSTSDFAAGPNAQRALLNNVVARHTLPYALMRKAVQKEKERRRHPSKGSKKPITASDGGSEKTSASEGTTTVAGGGDTGQAAAVSAWSASASLNDIGDYTSADTAPPPTTNAIGSSYSPFATSSSLGSSYSAAFPTTKSGARINRLMAYSAQRDQQHRHHDNYRVQHHPPIYSRRQYRPIGDPSSSSSADGNEQLSAEYEDTSSVAGGWSRGGRRPAWTQLRRVAEKGQRAEMAGQKYTTGGIGLGPIRHQTNRKVLLANRIGGGRSEEAAVMRPKTYSSGAGSYAPPDTQIDIKTATVATAANSDEPDLQSVVEQHVLDDALAQQLTAAGLALTTPNSAQTVNAENYVSFVPTQQPQQQMLHGQQPMKQQPQPQPIAVYQNQQKGQKFTPPPFPSMANSYSGEPSIQSAFPNNNAAGFPCPPSSASSTNLIRNSRSEGCGGGDFGGGAPSEISLACGTCSCSQCQCSSLPSPCSGPSCPVCPSVCSCPSECGCSVAILTNEQAAQQQYQQQYNQWYQQYGQQYYSGQGYTGGSGLNAAFATMQCFSGDQLVRTPRGRKRMDELRVGELVLSMDESLVSFSPVLMFLHRKPSERATYLRLRTAGGHVLQLTALHLIWAGCKGRLRLIPARELRVGECVYAMGEEEEDREREPEGGRHNMANGTTAEEGAKGELRMVPSQIIGIQKVEEIGIYAPLTATGNILVNGVLASCHANMAAQTLQQTFFNWWRVLRAFAGRTVLRWWTGPLDDPNLSEGDGELPLGLHFLTTVLDSLLPDDLIIP